MTGEPSADRGADPRQSPGATVERATRLRSDVALARATIGYLWCGVVLFLVLSARPIFSADSFSYKDRTHRNFQMALFSLEGKLERSPTIVVPFAVLGSNTSIEYGQTVLLGLAFTFLILTVYKIEWIGVVTKAALGFLLATMLLSPELLSWNLQILSEPLSVSYALIAFTGSLRFLLRGEPKWLLLSSGAAMFAVSAKATLGFIFVPLIATELVLFIRRFIVQRRDRGLPSNPRGILRPVGVVTGVCLMTGVGILYVSMQDHASLDGGIGKEKDAVIHLISIEDPINTTVRLSLRTSDIPKCVPLDRAVPNNRIIPLEFRLTTSCPRFTSWSVHQYPTWYARFLLTHPSEVQKLVADLLPYSLGYGLHEQGVFAVIPPLSDSIWGTYSVPNAQAHASSPQLPPLGFEDLVYPTLVAVNLAGIWLLLVRRRRRAVGTERLRLFWYFLFITDAALVVIVSQVLFLTNTGLGADRIALEAVVLLRVSLILVIGLAIQWSWARWRRRTAHEEDGPVLARSDAQATKTVLASQNSLIPSSESSRP